MATTDVNAKIKEKEKLLQNPKLTPALKQRLQNEIAQLKNPSLVKTIEPTEPTVDIAIEEAQKKRKIIFAVIGIVAIIGAYMYFKRKK